MRKLQFTHEGKTYQQITKATAKKLYLQGFDIVLCASNIRPFNIQGVGYAHINRRMREGFVVDEIGLANDFNAYINSFAFYNCNNECGRYVVYYVAAVTGLHLTFSNGSNPWLVYGDMETVQKHLLRWSVNYELSGLRVSAGGIVDATATEKRREAAFV